MLAFKHRTAGWDQHKTKHVGQWNRTEDSKINSHSIPTFDKCVKMCDANIGK